MIDLGRYARIEREYVCDWKPGMPFRSEQVRKPPKQPRGPRPKVFDWPALIGDGTTVDDLAERCGLTPTQVRQRLAYHQRMKRIVIREDGRVVRW